MQEIIDLIIKNLYYVSIGVGIFVMAYLSNMAFGIWYNVRVLEEAFDWKKILRSLLKVLAVGAGIVLLTITITLVVPFAQLSGLPIPEEYGEVVTIVAVLCVCLKASLTYIKEAWTKMSDILNM